MNILMIIKWIKTMLTKECREYIKEVILNTLQETQSTTLPIPIQSIVAYYENILLISYSYIQNLTNYTYPELIHSMNSEDACTCYDKAQNIYIIYYNDIDYLITNSNRYRWNIAHELGHILLLHHITTEKARIFRNNLSNQEYNELEEEADYFASLLLVPYAALHEFIQEPYDIEYYCDISKAAANRRFYNYNRWKQHMKTNISDFYDVSIFKHYYDFIYRKTCTTCDTYLIKGLGKYCIICGKRTLKQGNGDMVYDEFETQKNGKLKICPVCENEETNSKGKYCKKCGYTIANYCTNEHCKNFSPSIFLPSNARHCPLCGYESIFFKNNLLPRWEFEFERLQEYISALGFNNLPFN